MDKEILAQNLITNILLQCDKSGEKPTNACIDAGVGASFISDIKRGRLPSIHKVVELAEHFGCDTSDLVGDKKGAVTTRDSQTELFMKFLDKLSQEQKDALGKILEEKKDE